MTVASQSSGGSAHEAWPGLGHAGVDEPFRLSLECSRSVERSISQQFAADVCGLPSSIGPASGNCRAAAALREGDEAAAFLGGVFEWCRGKKKMPARLT